MAMRKENKLIHSVSASIPQTGDELGYQSRNYVLQGRIMELLRQREKGIITDGDLERRCIGEVNCCVNGGINHEYLQELNRLLKRDKIAYHKGAITCGEAAEAVMLLKEEYSS